MGLRKVLLPAELSDQNLIYGVFPQYSESPSSEQKRTGASAHWVCSAGAEKRRNDAIAAT
jgi:hypothetical protein